MIDLLTASGRLRLPACSPPENRKERISLKEKWWNMLCTEKAQQIIQQYQTEAIEKGPLVYFKALTDRAPDPQSADDCFVMLSLSVYLINGALEEIVQEAKGIIENPNDFDSELVDRLQEVRAAMSSFASIQMEYMAMTDPNLTTAKIAEDLTLKHGPNVLIPPIRQFLEYANEHPEVETLLPHTDALQTQFHAYNHNKTAWDLHAHDYEKKQHNRYHNWLSHLKSKFTL